jgi:dipeptidyl aminopeptidase/acylaminoacyl peptidase
MLDELFRNTALGLFGIRLLPVAVATCATFTALSGAQQPASPGQKQPAPPLTGTLEGAPPPPPGTEKVLNYDRHGTLIAACAQKPGHPVPDGGRTIPPTEVWITDGRDVWKTATGLGTCDPAWSPDGSKLAVSAPDGIWVLSGANQQDGERFTDVRVAAHPAATSDHLSFEKPAWSPDGTRLAAVVRTGPSSWVEVMDVTTGRRLYKSEPGAIDYRWGADSQSLTIGGRTVQVPRS